MMGDSVVLLNREGHNLLKNLSAKEFFLMTDLEQESDGDEKSVKDFLSQLIRNKIVELV